MTEKASPPASWPLNLNDANDAMNAFVGEASGYAHPMAVLVTAPSKTRFDLSTALDSLRSYLTGSCSGRWTGSLLRRPLCRGSS